MAVYKSLGLQLAIATTFAAQKTMSAITNATAAVGTLEASHGVVVNDIIEVTSGWSRLDKRVVRVSVVATNDVTLEGIDTTSTTLYPATEGAGTVREISTWTSITQLLPEFTVTGGGFEQDDVTQMTSTRRTNRPGLAEASSMDFTVFWDPALTWLATVRAARNAAALTPFRIITASGAKLYGNAYWGFNEEPRSQNNSFVTTLQLAIQVDTVTYTA